MVFIRSLNLVSEKLNNCKVYNKEKIIDTVDQVRKSGRSLITYSNHDSCIDDPTTLGKQRSKIKP